MVASLLIAAFAAGLADAPPAGVTAQASLGDHWGKVKVARVELVAPGLSGLDEARSILGVKVGDVLSRVELRAGVQALIASGQIEDAVVTVEPLDDGVAVLVKASVASRVRTVRVHGLSRRLTRPLVAQLDLPIGRPVRVAYLETVLDRATQFLRDEGYPEARLEPDLAFDVTGGSVDVTVTATLGPAAKAGSIRIDGFEMSETEAWKSTGLKPDGRLTVGRLESARRELTRRLQRRGFWETEVDSPIREGEGGRVLRFPVRPGARYTLDLTGIRRNKALEKEALGFVRGDEPFSEVGLDDVTRRVRTHLQRIGRLLARVDARVEVRGDEKVLHLVVVEGPRLPIRAVRFPGVTSVPAALLEERVGARTGHPWRWGGEPVDDDTLAADAGSVLGTLRERGFPDAKVERPRIVEESGAVAIEFPAFEGQRYTVGELTVEGVPEGVTAPPLPIVVDGPWNLAAEDLARGLLESAIREKGYLDATVKSFRVCESGRCRVGLVASPGEASRVGRVVIAGLARTRMSVVKKVADLEPGEVAGPEAWLAAQRRMLGLGIFQRVAVRPIPGQVFGAERGILIDVDEAQSRAVTVGVGWDNVEQARVSLSWSELNLFGGARSLGFDTRVSGREKRLQISYREPSRLGILGFPTWVSVFRTEESYTDYDLLRRGMWVEFGDRKRRPGRVLLRYDYQITLPSAPDDILSELERDKQQAKIASITPILEWDTRDDVFSPSRGLYATAAVQEAFEVFDADSPFEKAMVSAAGFTKVGGGVLAASLRSGVIRPRNRCEAPCPTDNLRLPIAVRFVAGGRITHRAFPTDGLGAAGTFDEEGRTIGGASQLIANLEWRFPLFSAVGGSAFVDGGSVWPGWTDTDIGDLRWGAGVGLRIETPVGPFRLEYGWKLDRLPGESAGELFISFGNPF